MKKYNICLIIFTVVTTFVLIIGVSAILRSALCRNYGCFEDDAIILNVQLKAMCVYIFLVLVLFWIIFFKQFKNKSNK